MGEPYFVKGNAMGDERGQTRRGLGGIDDARFQAIVLAPARCRCTCRPCSQRPIANGRIQDNGEKVVVVPVEGGVPGDVVGGQTLLLLHLLRVDWGWRNFFSSCAVVSVFCSGGK